MENPLRTFVTVSQGRLTMSQAVKCLGSEQAVLEWISELPQGGGIMVIWSGSKEADQPAKPILICTEAHYQALLRRDFSDLGPFRRSDPWFDTSV